MSTLALNQIKNAALLLPIKERAWLIDELLESLEAIKDSEIEQAWVIEAEKRYTRYLAGEAKSRSAAEVFANLNAQLQ